MVVSVWYFRLCNVIVWRPHHIQTSNAKQLERKTAAEGASAVQNTFVNRVGAARGGAVVCSSSYGLCSKSMTTGELFVGSM